MIALRKRRGRWMITHRQQQFFPTDPRADEVFIADIAHALSQIVRWGGMCPVPFTVAQHSLYVSERAQILARERRPRDEEHETVCGRWGLLHAASEAYLGDVVRPLKHEKGMAFYRKIEELVTRAIAERFGLPGEMPEEVKQADEDVLSSEQRDFFPDHPEGFTGRFSKTPWPMHNIVAWEHRSAHNEFLERFRMLFPKDREAIDG